MKVWVLITGDGYYGGWFYGIWESEEKAIEALIKEKWHANKDGSWYDRKNYLHGDLHEIEINAFYKEL